LSKGLQKNFPETKKYKDIKEFNGKENEGKINIISGGIPCQPFSQAGSVKAQMTTDTYFLKMLRVDFQKSNPIGLVQKNVYGLLNIQTEGIRQVCTELENLELKSKLYYSGLWQKTPAQKRLIVDLANSRCKYGQRESRTKENPIERYIVKKQPLC
jgi:site-specific DNA-cytosine methylase